MNTPKPTNQQGINSNSNLITEGLKYFLGGFCEGEASTSVVINVSPSFPFGVQLQPVFNLTQHISGIVLLERMMSVLGGLGAIRPKSGNPTVMVYVLTGVSNLLNHLVPFYQVYVLPFAARQEAFAIFYDTLVRTRAGEQQSKESLIAMVRMVYSAKSLKGKARKRSMEEVISIIEDKDADFAKVAAEKSKRIDLRNSTISEE